MELPITSRLDYDSSVAWIIQYFHPGGLKCPQCQWPVARARQFGHPRRSDLRVYRCSGCATAYNLYAGTIFQPSHLTPMQVVLLLRRFCKGETTRKLAAEARLNHQTVLDLGHAVPANAKLLNRRPRGSIHILKPMRCFKNAEVTR